MNAYMIGFVILNIIFALFYAPLADGIERKVKARVQRRQGPPIMQTWYDLIKLFRRESLYPEESVKYLFLSAPFFAFFAILTAYLIVPTIFPDALFFYGDLIVLIYLLTFSSIIFVIGAFASSNPFAQVGGNREVSLMITEEFLMAFVVGTLAVITGTLKLNALFPLPLKISTILVLILYLIAMYVASVRLPFDIPEAEPEIAEGPFIEYSGKHLGFVLYTIYLKRILLASLFLNFILPSDVIMRTIGYIVGIILIPIILATIEAHMGRMRIDQAVRVLKKVSLLGLISWIIAFIGW